MVRRPIDWRYRAGGDNASLFVLDARVQHFLGKIFELVARMSEAKCGTSRSRISRFALIRATKNQNTG
jgi:hypothetical protein